MNIEPNPPPAFPKAEVPGLKATGLNALNPGPPRFAPCLGKELLLLDAELLAEPFGAILS